MEQEKSEKIIPVLRILFSKKHVIKEQKRGFMRQENNLNGIWDFEFSELNWRTIVPETLTFPGIISVPGCFDALAEYSGRRGTGIYRRFVECGGKVKLKLGAIGLRANILWDRKEIGIAEHPYSPESFVFDAGKPGTHELLIVTDNRPDSGNASLFHPYYDFYAYGGIYSDVALIELSAFYIDRAEVIPEDITDGSVRIRLYPEGDVPEHYPVAIRFDSQETGQCFELKRGETDIFCKVPGFKLWSPEAPNLHTVQISLPDDAVSIEFGIRKIECRDGNILLNGNPEQFIAMPYARYRSFVYGWCDTDASFTVNHTTPARKTYVFECQGKTRSIDRWWMEDLPSTEEINIDYN